MKRITLVLIPLLALAACAHTPSSIDDEMTMEKTKDVMADASRLERVVDAQPEEIKNRYPFRNPKETLTFFDIKPGMVVVEALPGGGWYTKILLPYLGGDGILIGADYAVDMYPLFGFFSEERIEAKKTWVKDWAAEASEWRGDDGAPVKAFQFGSMPTSIEGKADAVLFIRALHNLSRFESQGGYLSQALSEAHRALKPGGIVGIVQHQAPDSLPDEWADGSRGYLKRDMLISRMEKAGFEYVGSSDINANPKDQPGSDDIVWRLPPSLVTSREDPALREKMQAIGESNRMTLKFRKPTE